jgi:hypothetical protein
MPAEIDRMSPIQALLAETRGSIEQAQAAIDSGQGLDLRTLEASMARLCACALDLPPSFRPQACAALETLQQPMDCLFEILAGRAA